MNVCEPIGFILEKQIAKLFSNLPVRELVTCVVGNSAVCVCVCAF